MAHSSSTQAAQRPVLPGPGAPPHVGQVSPAAAPGLGAAALPGVVRAMWSPPAGPAGVSDISGVSHMGGE